MGEHLWLCTPDFTIAEELIWGSEVAKSDALHGSPIRVSTVDPGLVQSEFSVVRFRGDAERARKIYENTRPLQPEDVAEAVLFCATRPPHATLAELVLLASDQAPATTVYRRELPESRR